MKRTRLTAATAFFVFAVGGAAPAAEPTVDRCLGAPATITGTDGRDRLMGTPGDDVIAGRKGADVIFGRGGNDLICGDGGADLIRGGRGADFLRGGVGDDDVRGGRGADDFDAGHDYGNDEFNGGRGKDWLLLTHIGQGGVTTGNRGPAQVDLATGFVEIEGKGRDSATLGSIENVFGTGQGDQISGDENDNVLTSGPGGGGEISGRGGNDVLAGGQDGGTIFHGGTGDDVINVFDGPHQVAGDEGSDTIDFCGPYGGTSSDVEVDLAAGEAFMSRGEQRDRVSLESIENAAGCYGNDTLTGDDGPNVLKGRRGEDVLDGRAGDDELRGGAGNDTGDGGDGFDSCTSVEAATACE